MFPSKQFKAKAEDFILVKIDVDKDPKTADKYKVRGIPDIQFLAADGSVKHRATGFRGTEGLLSEMETAMTKG